MFPRTLWVLDKVFSLLILAFIFTGDLPRLTAQTDQVRSYTRAIEFDYPTWVWDAIWSKIDQSAINAPAVFDRGSNKQIVFEYLRTTDQLNQTEFQIEKIFADPNITDKESTSANLRTQRDQLTARQATLAPFAESVLQSQVNNALAELGLTTGGQTLPPLLYRSSPTPLALIISPRDHIEQTTNISILPSLTLDQQIKLEDDVANSLDVSTLIVPIGGIGVYPTMVMETNYFTWQVSTVVHEWVHNFLSLRPLGLLYASNPELRTINETVASIVESEVGPRVIQNFYPQMLASSADLGLASWNPGLILADDPPFDFRAEMHTTRVRADELLADGKIDEAETSG